MNPNQKDKTKTEKDLFSLSRRNFFVATAATGSVLAGGALKKAYAAESTPMAHEGMKMEKGSMMFMKGHKMAPGTVIAPTGSPSDDEVDYKEFDMEVRIVKHEIVPGIEVHLLAFNGQVPGPEFHVMEGDWIKVNFTNKTEVMHTIHWHGLTVPYTMDGVPMVTQDPVHPENTFIYRFQAKPAGTRWYHCHWSTPTHAALAMHGAFIIHKKNDPLKKRFPYTRDYTLILESFDVDHAREEINAMLEGMKELNILMAQGKLDPMTHGFFRNYQEFLDAFQSGEYVPPYLQGRSSGSEIEPNFFAINGKSYPATKRILIKQGEWIRIRFISASNKSHHMHLHGHDFWWVSQDGNDLAEPRQVNTVHVEPGGTYDIMVYGDNPGYWSFHDHLTNHARNNGVYPGGMLTLMEYEDLENPPYIPSLSVDQ